MRNRPLVAAAAAVLFLSTCIAFAQKRPRIIARPATVNKPRAEAYGQNAGYVSVRAELRGTYGLGSESTTIGRISHGVAGKKILTAAGAQPSGAAH
jgi:hypothetical protein